MIDFVQGRRRRLASITASALIGLLGALASVHAAEDAALTIEGVAPNAIRYSMSELRSFPRQRVVAEFPANRKAECDGVRLADILAKSGVAMGKALAGPRLTETLLVTARDGYSVAFVLTELDPEFTSTPVLLCLALDGSPITDDSGPLRVVVPNEQRRHARWVRQVTRLTLRKGS